MCVKLGGEPGDKEHSAAGAGMQSTEPRSESGSRAAVLCHALALALRRRPPSELLLPLTEEQASARARAKAQRGPTAAEAEARCVVLAAGAHHAGGVDPSTPPCAVGAEDGLVYRAWRWLAVAWPVNVLLYLLALPLAEVLWWFASRHYVRVRSATPHVVRLGAADAAIALRFYRRAARERTPAELAMVLLRWFHGDWPSQAQMRQFLGWTIYNAIGTQLAPGQAAALGALVDDFARVLDRPFAPEHRCAPDWMLYTREPLAESHKPLWFYLVLQTKMRLVGRRLRRKGFGLLRAGALRYWYRPPRPPSRGDQPPPPLPVVFLHGVLGLMPYGVTLDLLADEHAGAVFLPTFPTWSVSAPPSVRLGECERPIQLPELVGCIRQMLSDQRAARAAFLANSVGTGLLGALLERAPELAASAVFSDPICFELSSGDVLHNFLYAEPACCGGVWPIDLVRSRCD